MYRALAILLGIAATLLVILSVATYYGYWPSTLTDGLSYGTIGVLGILAGAAAIGCEVAAEREKRYG
jgi:hypothetical protein